MRRSLILSLVLSAGCLIWLSGVFGNVGFVQAYRMAQVRRNMALRIEALESERGQLARAAAALESDADAQESAIRDVLGFVREDELVFEFR